MMNRLAINKFKNLLLLVGIIGLTASCVGSNPSSPASPLTEEEQIITEIEQASYKTTFLLTDGPSDDFKSVKVDIKSPIVITHETVSGGPYLSIRESPVIGITTVEVPLPDNLPIRVDLLELDEVSEALASAVIPAGTITSVSLSLSNPEIVLLDDTSLDASKIDFSPVLDITPANPIIASGSTGMTILLDFDVDASLKIDITGSGRPVFRPTGSGTAISAQTHAGGVEARRVYGTVSEIPGIKDNPKSFLLKHRDRRFFIQVEASTAEIYNFRGKTPFENLRKDQRVEVRGLFTHQGILKAKSVVILPEEHKEMRGIIANLGQASHAFELRPIDRAASSTETITISYNPNELYIFQPPDTLLGPSDLTNGQIVTVRGIEVKEENRLAARVIVVEPERIRVFLSEVPNCASGIIRVIHSLRESRRLLLAGIDLGPQGNFGIVDIGGAEIFGLDGAKISCIGLGAGMAVHLLGRMVPHLPDATDPNPVQIKALQVKRIAVHDIKGKVVSVADDGKSLVLEVPVGTAGFDLPETCVALEGFLCDRFLLDVIRSERLYNPDGLPFNNGMKGLPIRVAGYFMGERRGLTADAPRKTSFLAIVIREIKELSPSPTSR